jgi:hypothetical protein
MATTIEELTEQLLNDFAMEGQRVEGDVSERFARMALVAESVILAGAIEEVKRSYMSAMTIELSSAGLVANRAAREAFERVATRALRWIVLAVGAVYCHNHHGPPHSQTGRPEPHRSR